jgi:gamma-glutamylcyclotransferase (GGCT)/AIG2-like uncharacterized protein YtfP
MSGCQSVLLFSYGTLQQEDVQLASFGRLLEGTNDAIPGYKQSFIEITDPEVIRKSGSKFHPIIVPTGNPENEVKGKVYKITESELIAADAYEVSDYKRVGVRLRSGKKAWVYIKA